MSSPIYNYVGERHSAPLPRIAHSLSSPGGNGNIGGTPPHLLIPQYQYQPTNTPPSITTGNLSDANATPDGSWRHYPRRGSFANHRNQSPVHGESPTRTGARHSPKSPSPNTAWNGTSGGAIGRQWSTTMESAITEGVFLDPLSTTYSANRLTAHGTNLTGGNSNVGTNAGVVKGAAPIGVNQGPWAASDQSEPPPRTVNPPEEKLHIRLHHRHHFLHRSRNRSLSPKSNTLPESFRPWKNVFDQTTIHPRPWKQREAAGEYLVESLWCKDNSVPPEQAEVFKKTEDSMIATIKSVTMFSAEVVVKILESGILDYVPIPGLSILAKVLVKIWRVVQGISNNRLRLLRLTQRCAHLLMSIKRDVETAGEKIHISLQNALMTLQNAFDKVCLLAESQVETPFLQRLLGSGNVDAEFSACDEELNMALRMFSVSVQISTMKLVLDTTDGLRQQNEELMIQNQQLYALYTPGQQQRRKSANRSPSPHYLADSAERRHSTSADMKPSSSSELQRSLSLNQGGSVHRPTASSRNKQVVLSKPIVEPQSPSSTRTIHRSSNRRGGTSNEGSLFLKRMQASSHEGEDPIEKIKQHQRLQNEFDRQSDVNDMRQIIGETLAEGKDSLVIKLLQIDSRDYPQAITVLEHELREYQAGKRQVPVEDKHLRQDLLQRGVDAMKRMTRAEDLIRPDWTINKFRIIELETIGYGSFSTVRRGLWNGQTVAIKILSPKTKRSVFEHEMRIWKSLSHPNILPLFGSSNSTEEPLFFVSLYAKHGNLVDFLQAIRQNDLEGVFGAMLKEQVALVNSARKRHSMQGSPGGMREQAHHNRWQAEKTGQEGGEMERLYTLPLSKSESKFNHCHILKEGDLYGFMIGIAKGMDYLHENGILHGDLKASNVLVNDDLSCIISDFGQSERRSDISRASGWIPRGTARWKAPELLTGSEVGLTAAIDVYAFAITCIEILSMGNIPWGSAEDSSLAHRIVAENLRPPIPSDFKHPRLEQLLERWWHKDPANRPEFKAIVLSIEALVHGLEEGALDDVRRKMSQSAASLQSVEAMSLPDCSPRSLDSISVLSSPFSPNTSTTPHDNNRAYFPVWVASNFSDLHLSPRSPGETGAMPTPMLPNLSEPSSWEPIQAPRYSQEHVEITMMPSDARMFPSSSTVIPISDAQRDEEPFEGGPSGFVKVNHEDSEVLAVDSKLGVRLEELYRHVRHEFHWNLRIPLWNPVLVEVGDVGYLNGQNQTFVTLFNAFEPCYSPSNSEVSVPSLMGFGDPIKKQVKISTQKAKKLFRAFTYRVEVEAGRPTAHCFCESPDWCYMENTRSPQAWFKATVDTITEIHSAKHNFAKEELLLVVGSLQAARYSLLVSHNHPNGTIEFTGNSGKKGRPWGSFGAISIHGGGTAAEGHVTDNRVSDVASSHKALFLAALHFPPGGVEPTLK